MAAGEICIAAWGPGWRWWQLVWQCPQRGFMHGWPQPCWLIAASYACLCCAKYDCHGACKPAARGWIGNCARAICWATHSSTAPSMQGPAIDSLAWYTDLCAGMEHSETGKAFERVGDAMSGAASQVGGAVSGAAATMTHQAASSMQQASSGLSGNTPQATGERAYLTLGWTGSLL
jgi:hypothetical protein